MISSQITVRNQRTKGHEQVFTKSYQDGLFLKELRFSNNRLDNQEMDNLHKNDT